MLNYYGSVVCYYFATARFVALQFKDNAEKGKRPTDDAHYTYYALVHQRRQYYVYNESPATLKENQLPAAAHFAE